MGVAGQRQPVVPRHAHDEVGLSASGEAQVAAQRREGLRLQYTSAAAVAATTSAPTAAAALIPAGTTPAVPSTRSRSEDPALREQVRRNLAAQDELAEEFHLLTAADAAALAGSTAIDPERLVRDWREQCRVFVVPTADGPQLPGFQFDERGVPLPAIADVLAAFADRLSGWGLALWFTGSNGWLGDRRPVDVLDSDPELVARRPPAWPRSCRERARGRRAHP